MVSGEEFRLNMVMAAELEMRMPFGLVASALHLKIMFQVLDSTFAFLLFTLKF